MTVMKELYLANNIRILRTLYGETQETLGRALSFSKNYISCFETGKKTPTRETIETIAIRYSISVEDLCYQDLSHLDKKRLDIKEGFWYAEVAFPLMEDDSALENKCFREAYDDHRSFIDLLTKNDQRVFESHDPNKILELYSEAQKSAEARNAAAINTISILLMISLFSSIPEFADVRTVVVDRLIKQNPKMTQYINEIKREYNEETKKQTLYSETHDAIYEALKELCHTAEYADIAYYYLALCYWVNYTDNSYGLFRNQRVACDMIDLLALIGNKYALFFKLLFIDQIKNPG